MNEIEQKNYNTIDTVVDTIIRTTGGLREARQFISENPINISTVEVNGKTYTVGVHARLRRSIIAMIVTLRISEWTPEAENTRRQSLLAQQVHNITADAPVAVPV